MTQSELFFSLGVIIQALLETYLMQSEGKISKEARERGAEIALPSLIAELGKKGYDVSNIEKIRVQAYSERDKENFRRAYLRMVDLKKKILNLLRGGDNPMTERIKEDRISESGLGVGGSPRKGKPKTDEERREQHIKQYGTEELPPRGTGLMSGVPVIIVNIETGETVPGGIVVNEEKALATSCHGYDLGEGKKILWSEGVIGGLSLPEQEKYCKKGMDLKPMTGALAKRIKALREAGIRFK